MATNNKSDSAFQVLNGNGEHVSCWSCGDMVAAHFCNACGKVQPAVPTDYFSFFGLPRKLNLDTKELEREMFALSRRLHPDLYAQASEQEQEWSLEQTSQLNDAYRTLRDPIARTEYLLKLEGVKSQEQSLAATEAARASGQQKKSSVPADLLEEVFELNMQLEELNANKRMGEDDPNLARDLHIAAERLSKKLEGMKSDLHKLWDEWDALNDANVSEPGAAPASDRRSICLKMLDLLNRRRYVQHLLRDISDAMAD